MRKKSFDFIIAIILIFVFITVTCLSCQIGLLPENKISESEENNSTDVGTNGIEGNKEEGGKKAEEIISVSLWIDENVPEDIAIEIKNRLGVAFDEIKVVDNKESSDIKVEIELSGENSKVEWVLVPVVSFFRICDDIYYDDFKKFWGGDMEALQYISIDNTSPELVLTEEVYDVLEAVLGKSKNTDIKIVSEGELAALVKDNDNNSFSIIPFNNLEKEYKALNVDNMSVFDRDMDTAGYPLCFRMGVKSDSADIKDKIDRCFESVYITNREADKMASVIMTGVTALARGKTIGRRMDEFGVLYPAEKIVDVLLDADITHISNEICFVEGCSSENRFPYLCSCPHYIELLEYIDTDVVELTGNHMNDYGPEWMLKTLDMYDERGWPYFGGGRNLEESYQPALFEVNGNKIAFLGVNAYGLAANEWAGEDSPGAARLNVWDEAQKEEDFKKVEGIIKELKEQGYLVIFTFQYQEFERYSPTENQIADFRRIIDAGTDIVSGSQSHWPMGVEFRGDGFINYGLGNLFYNMRDIPGLKQGIIAKHIFYNGKYINTIMITTMLEDLSQPRLTTPEEREELLNSVFAGSIR